MGHKRIKNMKKVMMAVRRSACEAAVKGHAGV